MFVIRIIFFDKKIINWFLGNFPPASPFFFSRNGFLTVSNYKRTSGEHVLPKQAVRYLFKLIFEFREGLKFEKGNRCICPFGLFLFEAYTQQFWRKRDRLGTNVSDPASKIVELEMVLTGHGYILPPFSIWKSLSPRQLTWFPASLSVQNRSPLHHLFFERLLLFHANCVASHPLHYHLFISINFSADKRWKFSKLHNTNENGKYFNIFHLSSREVFCNYR